MFHCIKDLFKIIKSCARLEEWAKTPRPQLKNKKHLIKRPKNCKILLDSILFLGLQMSSSGPKNNAICFY